MLLAVADVLADLGIILAVAGLASVLFQRLRQPAVLGYLAAGVLLGPHVLRGLTVDVGLTHSLAELGVILLMFSIGLEFRLRKLLQVGIAGGLTALIEVSLMVSLGYGAGLAFGYGAVESLFLGGCLGISSTMLVASAFAEQGVRREPFVEVTYAILIFEDLLAILLIVLLTAVSTGRGLGPAELAVTLGRLFGFLALLLAGGLVVIPRFIRWVARVARAETLMVVAVALCFVMATMAEAAGYSVALGAFLAGILVAESGESHAVDAVIGPLRDIFAAIFFISVGSFLDPRLVLEHWLPIVVLTGLVLVGKTAGVTVGSFLAGNGLKRSVRAGMSLAQIGEFAFIIATLGATSGATGDFLLPVAVAVSCLTALTTPAMIRASRAIAEDVDHRLPRPLQTLTSFYEAWIEALRERPVSPSEGSAIRRRLLLLAVDAVLLVVVVAGHAIVQARHLGAIASATGLAVEVAGPVVVALAVALSLFFFVAIARQAQHLGEDLAARVLPAKSGDGPDLARVPRRVFVQIIEVAIALGLGLPLVAILGPFVPFSSGVIALALILGGLCVAAWRSLGNFQGHVRAGTEVVVELLARHTEAPDADEGDPGSSTLGPVAAILPGFGDLEAVHLRAGDAAVGQTLAELNLRALSGATVVAITREGEGVVLPSASERLRAGDALALAGAHAAVASARALLTGAGADLDRAAEGAAT